MKIAFYNRDNMNAHLAKVRADLEYALGDLVDLNIGSAKERIEEARAKLPGDNGVHTTYPHDVIAYEQYSFEV